MRLFFYILGGFFILLSVFDIASSGFKAFVTEDVDHKLVSESWGLYLPDFYDYDHILPKVILEFYDFVQSQISYQFFGILGIITFLLAPVLFPKRLK